jgi:hypothetical protein
MTQNDLFGLTSDNPIVGLTAKVAQYIMARFAAVADNSGVAQQTNIRVPDSNDR